jgi:hypothetical protein
MSSHGTLLTLLFPDPVASTSAAAPPLRDADSCGNLEDLEPYARKLRSLGQIGSLTLARIISRPIEQASETRPPTAGGEVIRP